MNFNNVPKSNIIIFFALSLVSTVSLGLLIYSLFYASPESVYKKHAFVISLSFIVVARFTLSFYKKTIAHD